MSDLLDYQATMPVLHGFQVDVTERSRTRLRAARCDRDRRGIIQAPTGSGKTYMAADITRAGWAKGSRVLLLADRRRLVTQMSGTLDRFRVPHGVIMSDASRDTRRSVILATRDTLAAWFARGLELEPFPLILIDEAHKSMGDTYQLLLSRYPRAVVIGLTATPARNDGRSLSDFWGWIECSVPESELIRDGYLVRPEVWAPLELAQRRQRGEKTKGAAGDPVTHWKAHARGLPTIAFCRSVQDSLGLRDMLIKGGIPAEHIDASTDKDADREAAFSRLVSGEISVLTSVGLLIEGIDIPQVAAAIIWAPFGSLVQWRQACGRIMRPCAGKSRAVVLDHVGAAAVHGLPGDDIEWSLDTASTVDDRRAKALEAGKALATVHCNACGLAFQGMRCPSCGWQPERERRERAGSADIYQARDEVLSKMDAATARAEVQESRQRHWLSCLAVAIARGRTVGYAAKIFADRWKLTPWNAGVKPLPPERDDWSRAARDVFPDFGRRRKGAA